jgi:cell division protein FtsL
MAHYLTVSPSMNLGLGRRKKTLKRSLQAGPVTLGYVAIFLVALICLFYLFQVVFVSTAGYETSALEADIKRLEKDNSNLQLEINEAQSLQRIQSGIGQSTLVPVEKVKFVTRDGSIASR